MELSIQSVPLDYFELPSPVTFVHEGRQTTKDGLVKEFTNALFTMWNRLSSRKIKILKNMYKMVLCDVNFFEFYASVVGCTAINKKIQVLLNCECRGNIVIDAFVNNINSLVSNALISDSYVKSFLAFFGKSEEMFDLYKSKDYKKFAIDSFLEPPILGSSMLSEYNRTSGDLVSYFVMERNSITISQIRKFFGCMKSNVEELNSNVHWLELKEEVTRLKPLQLLGIVRENLVLSRRFLESMQNPDKKQILMEINIHPLLDQMKAGSVTTVYVQSFLHAFCVKSAYQFFVKAKWDEFLSTVTSKRTT